MTPVTQTYMICATQRSGSTLLCHYLSNLKFAGNPSEHLLSNKLRTFQDSNQSFEQAIHNTMQHHCSENGVSGVKVMDNTWSETLMALRQQPEYVHYSDLELLSHLFPNVKLIFITRENKLRQAISLAKAEYSKTWERHSDNEAKKSTFRKLLHPFYLKNALARVKEREQYWNDFFNQYSLPFFHVSYEDIVRDPRQNIRRIIEYLEISVSYDFEVSQTRLKKQADIYTEILILYYHCYFFLYNRLPVRAFSGLRRLKHLILSS